MTVMRYNGLNVYTQDPTSIEEMFGPGRSPGSTREFTHPFGRERVVSEDSTIVDAYFARRTPDGLVERMPFNERKIKERKSGLIIEVNTKGRGNAFLAMSNLGEIYDLLGHAFGRVDVSDTLKLKSKKIVTYTFGSIQLKGIGIKEGAA